MWAEAQPLFHQLGLSTKQATALHQFVTGKGTAAAEAFANEPVKAVEAFMPRVAEAIGSEKYAETRTADLKQKWGQAFEAKMHSANRALSELAASDPTIAQAFKSPADGGYALSNFPGIVELMAAVGEKMGEPAGLVGGGQGGMGRAMTPDESQLAINQMMGNKEEMAILGNAQHPEHSNMKAKWDKVHQGLGGHEPHR